MTPRDISERLLTAAISTPSTPPAPWAQQLAADIAACATIHQAEAAIQRQLDRDTAGARPNQHIRARVAVLAGVLRWIDRGVEEIARRA